MTTEKLYIAWQDPQNRAWWPVGILTYEDNLADTVYRFCYTKGAQQLKEKGRFEPFSAMDELDAVYEADHLFPIFTNRLLPVSRPEYKRYLTWLGSTVNLNNPLTILAMTEGIRGTDNLEVFKSPEKNEDGRYEMSFLSHGLRYLTQSAINRINNLTNGERLFIMFDMQNKFDDKALALRTDDPAETVGYCPRYLSHDFLDVLLRHGANEATVTVEKVNPEAPLHLRLLCKFVAPWHEDFSPCTDERYQPIVEYPDKNFHSAGTVSGVPA